MGILKFINTIKVVLGFITPFAMILEVESELGESTIPGSDKRDAVVSKLKDQMEESNLSFPDWISSYTDLILGLLVDLIVFILNKTGFFVHGGSTSTTS